MPTAKFSAEPVAHASLLMCTVYWCAMHVHSPQVQALSDWLLTAFKEATFNLGKLLATNELQQVCVAMSTVWVLKPGSTSHMLLHACKGGSKGLCGAGSQCTLTPHIHACCVGG